VLSDFEVQYPVSFAIELQQLSEEKPNEAARASMLAMAASPASTRRNSLPAQQPPQLPMSARPGLSQASPASSTRSLSPGVGGRSTDNRARQKGKQPRTSTDAESQSTSTNISDEADSFKKLRRQTYYRECSRQFVRYFSDAGTHYVFDADNTLMLITLSCEACEAKKLHPSENR